MAGAWAGASQSLSGAQDWGLAGLNFGFQTQMAEKATALQRETNQMNIDLFDRNMAWQEYMANTAHQREVNDLRLAGLNPILSVNRGSPMGSTSIPQMISPGSHLPSSAKNAVDTAISAYKASNENKLTKATIDKVKSEATTNAKLGSLYDVQKVSMDYDNFMKQWDSRQRKVQGEAQQSKAGQFVTKLATVAEPIAKIVGYILGVNIGRNRLSVEK